jgi:sigma-B regulation protein RsbU (phosphoserine phosphatase)
MELRFFDRFRDGLVETRENLLGWLNTAPEREKHTRLGPANEQAVRRHLQVVGTALEKTNENTLGQCIVCGEAVEPERLEMDYTSCVCLDHFSEQEKRNLEFELELAQSAQKTLLPQEIPDIPGLEISAFSRPAQIIGGDYFDFFQFRNGARGLAIADVAGHGVSASLHMASVQTMLRTLVPVSESPLDVVRQMHHIYNHNIRFTTFVTLFLSAYDSLGRTLTYCNAGHNPPLVFRNTGDEKEALSWLQPTGAAIGLVEEPAYTVETIQLQPGDILVLYTDGITEARNLEGEFFGSSHLLELIQKSWHSPAKDLVQAIRQGLQDFTNGIPLEDDATIIVSKING